MGMIGTARECRKVWRRDDALAELRRLMPELQLKYGVTKIGVFGSVARDEAKPGSDLDIVVHLKTPDLLIMGAVLNDLEEVFDCKVDLIRWREDLGPVFLAELQRDLVYEYRLRDSCLTENSSSPALNGNPNRYRSSKNCCINSNRQDMSTVK